MKHSHEQQRVELLDTPFHEFAAFYLLPLTDTEDVTFNFSRNMPLAEKLNSPEISPVPRLVPYKDELLSTPRPRGTKNWYFIGFFLLVSALVHYGMWIRSAHYGLESHVGTILQTGKFSFDPDFTLKRKYVGIKAIDNYLVFLAAAYMPGLNNWDKNFGMLQMYFLGMLVQPITVWSVEAYRKRNMLMPLSLCALSQTLPLFNYSTDQFPGSLSGSHLSSGPALESTCPSITPSTHTFPMLKPTGGHSTEK